MPTGVTVASDGRIWVNFPKWGDPGSLHGGGGKNGKTVPYPDAAINHYTQGDNQAGKLVSEQSVVVDPTGRRLWILDTGSIGFGPVAPDGPKLVAVDLATNQVTLRAVPSESGRTHNSKLRPRYTPPQSRTGFTQTISY
jgi:Major royal jelly protein